MGKTMDRVLRMGERKKLEQLDEMAQVVARMTNEGHIRLDRAEAILAQLRKEHLTSST